MTGESDPGGDRESPAEAPPVDEEVVTMVPEPEPGDPGDIDTEIVAKGGQQDGTEIRIPEPERGDPGEIRTEPVTEGERRNEAAE